MRHMISFPIYEANICGHPATVTLTDKQFKALALVHRGGMDAFPSGKGSCTLMRALCAAGMFDRDGLSYFGAKVARECSDAEHNHATA